MEKIKDINRLNDVFFKSLLGSKERKNLTLNFLNSILNKDEDSYFVDINFLDKERLPDIETGKVPELDILAKLNDGTLINVEIQVTKQEYFSKRSLYYWSRLYAYQLNKGQNYDELKQTITINLLNFNYLPYETCHNSYHVYNDKTQDILIDDLELHFIELNKFKLSDIRKLRQAENWIAYFSPKCTDEQREAIAMNNPVIKEALNYEMVFSQDEIKRRQYEIQEKAIRDYNSTIVYNRKEGLKEGLEKGLKEGLKEGLKKGAEDKAIEIALKMLENGSDVNFIADVTGLSVEKINEIKK